MRAAVQLAWLGECGSLHKSEGKFCRGVTRPARGSQFAALLTFRLNANRISSRQGKLKEAAQRPAIKSKLVGTTQY